MVYLLMGQEHEDKLIDAEILQSMVSFFTEQEDSIIYWGCVKPDMTRY